MGTIVRGKYVLTDANEGEKSILKDGAVYFSRDIIEEVGDYKRLKNKYPDADIKGNGEQLLMPGLIDAHTHGWGLSCIQRGVPYDYLENALIDWAYLYEIDPELNAMMCAVRHLRSGCTTIHHNNWGEGSDLKDKAIKAVENYKKVGIRVAYSPGVRNKNTLALDDKDFFETLPSDIKEFAKPMVYYDKKEIEDYFFEIFEDLYKKYNNDDTKIILGPSWAQGCEDTFLQRVKQRADELGKLPIHIHTLQTRLQKAYGIKKYGKSLLEHLDDIGLVDENLVLGHAVYLTESDIELLASKRASTTHHPSCNLAIRNGISPVYYINKAGVNVALGIDDKGINDDEDIIMEIRMIHKLNRVPDFDLENRPALNAFDVLKMATTNAAKVCGFGGQIGALRQGMKADVIVVDLKGVLEDPCYSEDLNIAELFVHRAKGTDVNTVIVNGKVIMEERKFLTIDIDLLYKEVCKQSKKGLSSRQKEFADQYQRIKPYYYKWYKDWLKEIDFEPFYIMNSRI